MHRIIFELAVGLHSHTFRMQRGTRRRLLEHTEVLQHVAPVAILLLVDFPTDAGRLQPFGVSGPRVTARGRFVDQDRTASSPFGIDHAGHQAHALGPCRPKNRTMISVANGERFGQRELKRNIGPFVVAHDVRPFFSIHLAMGREPPVHLSAVPGFVLHKPRVAGGWNLLRAASVRVEVKGQQVSVRVLRVRLAEDGPAVGELHRFRIVEAADARQCSEIVIEGAILLHEDHHMTDLTE